MPIPTPAFSPWFPWSDINGAPPAATAALLRQVGCYLLARFNGVPPAGAALETEPGIFYIGETHGNTTSLWGRLAGFGTSAGFYGGQWSAHYAAWGYPARFPADDRGGGEDGAGRSCDAGRVFVAVCAWPGTMPIQLRGVFPVVIEQQAIWNFAEANGAIPALNNSGRVNIRPPIPMPEITDSELDAALGRVRDPTAAQGAVMAIAQRLAVGMKYAATRRTGFETYGAWRGAKRVLGKEDLYIGWMSAVPNEVTLSVYKGNLALYDGGAHSTRQSLRAAFEDFWAAWNP